MSDRGRKCGAERGRLERLIGAAQQPPPCPVADALATLDGTHLLDGARRSGGPDFDPTSSIRKGLKYAEQK
jgi:hypothetical protein